MLDYKDCHEFLPFNHFAYRTKARGITFLSSPLTINTKIFFLLRHVTRSEQTHGQVEYETNKEILI